jgi:tetratricopeptide (TPR) repeat protein
MIRRTETTGSEEETLALTGLYVRYGAYLEKTGYLRDAKQYYEDGLAILNREKDKLSDNHHIDWIEPIIYAIVRVNKELDEYKIAFMYIKQLKKMFPRKEEYRQAYIGCLVSMLAKYTNPVYIVIAILFLLKMGEIYLFHTHFIPGWLIDIGWVIWIAILIVQFSLPWILKSM